VNAASSGSGGRFGLHRLRAKPEATAFDTNRAFTHALPPSLWAPFVSFPVPFCFVPLPLLVKDKTKPETAEREKP
jgi:hypothetical protein